MTLYTCEKKWKNYHDGGYNLKIISNFHFCTILGGTKFNNFKYAYSCACVNEIWNYTHAQNESKTSKIRGYG